MTGHFPIELLTKSDLKTSIEILEPEVNLQSLGLQRLLENQIHPKIKYNYKIVK